MGVRIKSDKCHRIVNSAVNGMYANQKALSLHP